MNAMTGRRALLALTVFLLAACNAVTIPTPQVSTPGVATPGATSPTTTTPAASPPPTARTASPSPSPSASAPAPSPSTTAPGSPVVGGRYPDGLPRTLDGSPVLRGKAALAHAAAVVDDTPFLVTGWVTYEPGVRYCPLQPAGDTSWLDDCVQAQLANVAGSVGRTLSKAITFHFALDGLATGPVVVSVRVHDPRAGECGAAAAACDRLMVVQQVVWAGDEATAPHPLSAAAVADVVRSLQPLAQITPFGPGVPATGCGNDLDAATEYAISEPKRVRPIRPYVTRIEIEPSIAARHRALDVAAGARAALRPSAVVCTSFSRTPTRSWSEEYHWLAVANVVLLVRTDHRPSAADRAFIRGLARRLKAAAGMGQ